MQLSVIKVELLFEFAWDTNTSKNFDLSSRRYLFALFVAGGKLKKKKGSHRKKLRSFPPSKGTLLFIESIVCGCDTCEYKTIKKLIHTNARPWLLYSLKVHMIIPLLFHLQARRTITAREIANFLLFEITLSSDKWLLNLKEFDITRHLPNVFQ